MEERDVYAALGLKMPSQQPEAAEPAQNDATGGNESPAAEATAGTQDNSRQPEQAPETDQAPDGRRSSRGTEAAEPGTEDSEPETDGSEPAADRADRTMPRAERAEQARLRRERERKQAIDAAVAAERRANEEKLKEIFAGLGLTDRYHDNRPITNQAEYEQWRESNNAAGLNRRLKEGQLTPQDIQDIVEASPTIQQTRAVMERQEQERERQNRAAYERMVSDELAEISRIDPSVKTLEDALKLPTGKEFSRLVQENGLTFSEAFRLANEDRLDQIRNRTAREQAARAQASTAHLQSVAGGNRGGVRVPSETMEVYRVLHPDWSNERIREDYRKRTIGTRD